MATIGTSWTTISKKTITKGAASVTLYLQAKYTSQSITNNQTTGFYTRLYSKVNSGALAGAGYEFTCTYCSTKSGSGVWTFETETILISSAKTITHNNNGTKSLTISATVENTYWDINESLSGTATLPSINRLAYITSSSDFNDEENPTIEFANPNNYDVYPYLNFYDNSNNLVYQLLRDPDHSGTPISSPYTWTISSAERTALRNACNQQQTYRVNVGVATFDDDTQIGHNSQQQTLTITNAYPTIATPTFNELNPSVETQCAGATLINNKSIAKITIVPTAQKGATISKVVVSDSKQTLEDTTSPYEFTFNINDYTAGTNTFDVTVTDSRGYETVTDLSKSVTAYLPIKINNLSITREDATSSNLVIQASVTYYKDDNYNPLTNLTIEWKVANGSWATISDGYTYNNHVLTINKTVASSLTYENTADVQLRITDTYSTETKTDRVLRGLPTFDAGENDFNINGNLYVCDTSGNNQVALSPYRATDKYTISRMCANGFITGGRAYVYFGITLPRVIDSGITPTITGGTFTLRGLNGYLENSTQVSSTINYNSSNPIISIAYSKGNYVEFEVFKHDGSNPPSGVAFTGSTNNTPVSVFIENLEITFTSSS